MARLDDAHCPTCPRPPVRGINFTQCHYAVAICKPAEPISGPPPFVCFICPNYPMPLRLSNNPHSLHLFSSSCALGVELHPSLFQLQLSKSPGPFLFKIANIFVAAQPSFACTYSSTHPRFDHYQIPDNNPLAQRFRSNSFIFFSFRFAVVVTDFV